MSRFTLSIVVLAAMVLPSCFRASAVESSASTSSTGSSSGGTSSSAASGPSESTSSSGGNPVTCAGDATLLINTPGFPPPAIPDGGPPAALAVHSDAGIVISIGAGANPLEGACLALMESGCALCSTLSISLPPGIAPGAYTVNRDGVTVSQEGFGGSVTLTSLAPNLTGTFDLNNFGGCVTCDDTFQGTFDIPPRCTEAACDFPDAGSP